MTWEKVKLGDISVNIQTGPFGSQLHQSDYCEKGIPVVMPKDLANGKILEDSIARISEEYAEKLKRHRVESGDIIYSRRGDIGRCAYIDKRERGWICGTGCLRVTINEERANSRFIFYQLQQTSVIGWVINHAVGSTMLNLNTGILGEVPLFIPSMEIQGKIVDILSAYDDLIENHQRQIRLLEEAGARLYKEWFVKLRFPGHDTANITDGVPEGWKKEKIGNIATIHYGKDHKLLSYSGNIPVYGSGGFMRTCDQFLFDGEAVLIPRKGSLNNIMYVNEKFWTVDTLFYTTLNISEATLYLYFYLKSRDMYAMNIGAAVPSMTTQILNAMTILIPSNEILHQFNEEGRSFYNQIFVLKQKNKILKEARDRLLPRLMRGDVKV